MKEFDFMLRNVEYSEAKRLYDADYEDIHFEAYKDGTAYKVITEKQEILGEVPENFVDILNNNEIKQINYFIDKRLTNEGIIECTVQIHLVIK